MGLGPPSRADLRERRFWDSLGELLTGVENLGGANDLLLKLDESSVTVVTELGDADKIWETEQKRMMHKLQSETPTKSFLQSQDITPLLDFNLKNKVMTLQSNMPHFERV